MDDNKDPGLEEKKDRWRTTLRVINDSFKSRLDESVFEGVRDEKIYHGLKLTTTAVLHKNFIDMCFCDETQEYLVLDKAVEAQRYSMQGKLLYPPYPLDPSFLFTRMVWCSGGGCFICYDRDGEIVWALTSSCKLVKSMKNDYRIKCLHYEPRANEIVIVGSRQTIRYQLNDFEQDLESIKPLSYIDPEFGATWQLDYTSLIPPNTSDQPQLVASYLTTLYFLALELDPEQNSEGPLEYIARRTNATKSPITAIHYHQFSSWIIVGEQQGNVTGWSLSLECVMSVSGEHEDKLKMFASHPSICGFLSYSNGVSGSKLQVWSCNFRDAIENFVSLGEIRAIAIIESAATVVVLSAKLYYLTMHQAYCFYAPLTDAAKSLFSSQSPMYPTKVIAASEDNSVRMFSTHGKQLNVQILPKETVDVVSAVYSGNENRLFTIILKSGEILVSDTSVCPIKFKNVLVNDGVQVTCIAVYEYFDEVRDNNGRPRNPRVFYPIKIQIIVGTEEGNLVIVNHATGKLEAIIPAHTGSVLQLRASMIQKRAVSLGKDRCVKVWRVFADLPEPLALYYTLYFIIPITHISSMGHTLCMANSSAHSKVHQVIMENMAERVRLEHPSSKDHTAPIIDLIISETLELCATSSLDKTIRIWDRENNPLKILEINTIAWKTTFSSTTADLVFSAGRHLYKIPHENYLPPKYRTKIAANDLSEEEDEAKVPEDLEYKVFEHTVNRHLMLHPVSSTPLAVIDIANSNMPRVDLLIQKQIYALYEYRDEDIRKIKDNLLKATRVLGNRALMTANVWDKYVSDLLKSMTRAPAETPKYEFFKIRDSKLQEEKVYNERGVFQMLFGYIVDNLEEVDNLTELVEGSNLPLNTFLANSVLYKIKEDIPVMVEEPVPRKRYKYRYPAKFTGEEEVPEETVSLRLSQLMEMDNINEGGEEAV